MKTNKYRSSFGSRTGDRHGAKSTLEFLNRRVPSLLWRFWFSSQTANDKKSTNMKHNITRWFVFQFPFSIFLDSLALKTRWQRLCQLISLLRISHNQSVQVARASNLELGLSITLADLNKLGVSTTGLLKKIADISNLLWHRIYWDLIDWGGKQQRVSKAFRTAFWTAIVVVVVVVCASSENTRSSLNAYTVHGVATVSSKSPLSSSFSTSSWSTAQSTHLQVTKVWPLYLML